MPKEDDSPESQFIDPLIGTMIGRYRVERGIGQGGMGAVYELLQPAIHKRMALKLLHEEYADRPDIVRRFFDEARAVNLIGHPNIVDITDFSHLDDGRPFILMEHLDGHSLEDYLEKHGALPEGEVVEILRQLCSALGAAHEKGIVHRDLKPENIFLTRHPDGSLLVKVLDFGIAKLRNTTDSPEMETRTGVVLGTPTYMSPEQAQGNTQGADHRTDIYSLGVIIYQILIGAPPFRGKTFAELILKHIHHAPPRLGESRHDLAPAWDALVGKALAKEPSERFQSMSAVYDAAVAARDSVATAAARDVAESGAGIPVPLTPSGHKRWGLVAALTALALAAAIFVFWGSPGRGGAEPSASAGPVLIPSAAMAAPADAAVPLSLPVDAAAALDAGARDAGARDAGDPAPRATGVGTLRVSADPWALVFVDGRAIGQTPLRKEIPSGSHKIRLKNGSTGQSKTHRIHLKRGETESIHERW